MKKQNGKMTMSWTKKYVRKEIYFVIFLLFVSSVLTFTLIEIVLRFFFPQPTGPSQFRFHPELGYSHIPHQHAKRSIPGVYDYTSTNNEYGFRGNIMKNDQGIIFVGDSFTYGYGVNDNQTFCYLTNELLNQNGIENEVFNAGTGGKGTDYAIKFFNYIGYKFNPAMVCLCFFPNDFQDNQRNAYYNITNKQLSPKKLHQRKTRSDQIRFFFASSKTYRWLISYSHTVNLLKQTAMSILYRRKKSSQFMTKYDFNEGFSNNENIELTKLYIDILDNNLQKDNVDLLIFYIPHKFDIEYSIQKGKPSKDESSAMMIAQELEITFFSFTDIIKQSTISLDNINKYYFIEGHWTPKTHLLVAPKMSDIIKSLIKDDHEILNKND